MDNANPPVLPAAEGPPPALPPPLPPVAPPPPPQARRSGRGWKWAAIILFILLVVSGLNNIRYLVRDWFGAGARTGETSRPRLQEVVLEDHDAEDKIAVVDIEGIISGGLLDTGEHDVVSDVAHQLERARDDGDVKGVLLRVDSPGGEVLAADQINRAIAEYERKTGKPVEASMGGLAASGGYYVAAPCQWIVANELTITGSIGVIMHGLNYRGLMDKLGLRPEVYKSGKFKDMMSGERSLEETPPEERQMVQGLIDEAFSRFKQVVAEGRNKANQLNHGKGRALAANWQNYADGRVLSGRQAYDMGFVDELGDFKTAVARIKRLANLSKANLIQYEQPFDFGNLLRLLGQSEGRTLKLDWGAEGPKLQLGRMYFLFLPGLR